MGPFRLRFRFRPAAGRPPASCPPRDSGSARPEIVDEASRLPLRVGRVHPPEGGRRRTMQRARRSVGRDRARGADAADRLFCCWRRRGCASRRSPRSSSPIDIGEEERGDRLRPTRVSARAMAPTPIPICSLLAGTGGRRAGGPLSLRAINNAFSELLYVG